MESKDSEDSEDWTEIKLLKFKSRNFTLWGQSIAGTRTCIILEELKIVFDLGFFPRKAANCNIILLTHGHADHMGALHLHAFDRRMNRLDDPIYVMPQYCVDYFNQAYQSLKHLNRHYDGELNTTYKLIGSDPQKREDVLSLLKDRYLVRSYKTIHTVPSIGYVIFEMKKQLRSDIKQKLMKKEITQSDIKLLVNSGENVNEIVEKNLIAFTGDTNIDGLLQHSDMLNSETLIVECTYINSDSENDTPEECHKRGHIHEQDIVDNFSHFKCKELILCHFSRRYKKEEIFEARDRLQSLTKETIINVFI